MTKSKLPPYFKEYLDERFKSIDIRFNELHEEIEVLRNEIGNIKFVSMLVGAIGGILTTIASFLGLDIFRK